MTWSSNALSEPQVDVPQLEQLETQPEISTVPDDVKVPGYSDAYPSTSNISCAPNRPSGGSPPQPRFGKRPSDPQATDGELDAEEISPSSPKSAIAGQDGRKQGRTRRYWTPQVRIPPSILACPQRTPRPCAAADRPTCAPLTRSRVLCRSRKKQPFSKHSTDSVRRKWQARLWSLLLAGCLFDLDQVLLK